MPRVPYPSGCLVTLTAASTSESVRTSSSAHALACQPPTPQPQVLCPCVGLLGRRRGNPQPHNSPGPCDSPLPPQSGGCLPGHVPKSAWTQKTQFICVKTGAALLHTQAPKEETVRILRLSSAAPTRGRHTRAGFVLQWQTLSQRAYHIPHKRTLPGFRGAHQRQAHPGADPVRPAAQGPERIAEAARSPPISAPQSAAGS